MSEQLSSKILVVGLGGIGGIVSAHGLRAGLDLIGVSSNPNILQQLQTQGFCVRENGAEWKIKAQVFEQCPPDVRFDYIFLATPPTQVEAAASSVAHLLKDKGVFVCFQNGLIEARLAVLGVRGHPAHDGRVEAAVAGLKRWSVPALKLGP